MESAKNTLTHTRLKEILSYNPATGEFVWLKRIGSMSSRNIAGTPHYKEGYIRIQIDGRIYSSHRLAWFYMTGAWPKEQIDHIDHNRTNNSWCNLREATNQENQRNATIRSDNKSGITGVIWHKGINKWYPTIRVNGKAHPLGIYDNFFEACCARKSAENKFGFHPNHGKRI